MMKHYTPLLTPDDILIVADCIDKDALLTLIAQTLASSAEISATRILDALYEREALDSTALGHGIALPHGRVKGLKQAHALFIRLENPIDCGAADGQKVDLVLGLIFPPQEVQRHLEILSRAAQMFVDDAVCHELRHAANIANIYAQLLQKIH